LELEALMASATLHSIPGPTNSPLQARGLSTQALALAQELGYRAAEAKIYWNLMLLEIWGGADRQRAIEYGEKSQALAREFGLREQLAYTLHDLAMAHALVGQMDQAWPMQTEATQLWQELHNMPMYAESLNRAATVKFLTGELDKGISLAHDAYGISQSIGNVAGEALASYMLSYANGMLGQYAQTIEYGRDSTRYAQESPVGAMGLSIQGYLAWVYGSNGQIEHGIEIARQALQGVNELLLGKDERQLQLWSSFFRSVLIRLELLRGNLVGAQKIFAQGQLVMAEDAFDIQSIDMYSIFVAVAELKLAEADHAAALDTIDRLIGMLKRFPMRLFFPDAYYLKGKILQGQGLEEAAVEVWQTARDEAEAMSVRAELWQILLALAASCDRQGRHAEAAELLAQARTIVQYIAEHSPDDLRASFLALPQVQPVLDGVVFAGSEGRQGQHESR
jgi:tetratricopeptide (TPR) repeat protein